MMPVVDGREVLKALRSSPAHQHIPVLMMSAVSRDSIPTSCEPTAFLRKPFDIEVLLSKVSTLLDSADTSQRL